MACDSYPMEFGDTDNGQLITLLVEPIILDPSHDAHQLKIVHSGSICFYDGLLPAGFGRFTLCDVEVVKQSRIQASIMAKLPQPMEQDDVPDRLGYLEDQVQQLMQKQVRMNGQVQELSAQQAQSTVSLQSQISAQSHQLQGQIDSQNQSIQAMFENPLNHVRGLLSKRPRDDGE